MAEFAVSVSKTLAAEGGFKVVLSTGECVNFGITVRFLRSIGVLTGTGKQPTSEEISFVREMSRDYAISLYLKHFWNRYGIGGIADQALADKVFDLTVNLGAGGLTKKGVVFGGITLLQFAVNASQIQDSKRLKCDGSLGVESLAAVNALDPVELLADYRRLAAARYREIAQNPLHAADLPGWLARLAA